MDSFSQTDSSKYHELVFTKIQTILITAQFNRILQNYPEKIQSNNL